MADRPFEAKHRLVEATNGTTAFALGYLAAKAEGDRQHVTQNINTMREVLRDDLTDPGPHNGALAEAHLVVVGELVVRLCEGAVGSGSRAQTDYLRSIVREIKRQIADGVVDE